MTMQHEEGIYASFRRSLLTPQQVRDFSRLQPGRAALDTFITWTIIISCWVVVAIYPIWWVVLLVIPIIGCRAYALMILGHDGLHRRLFNGVKQNDLFCDTCILGAFGAITRINNRNHLAHHQHLASHEDPDRYKYTCLNKNTLAKLLQYLTGASSSLKSAKNIFLRRGTKTADESVMKSPRASYTVRDLAIIGIWQASLIGGLSWFIGWWAYPVLWMVPAYFFGVLGDNFRTFSEHTQVEPDEIADDHRLITYLANPVERMFFSPMNMNYHAVHHLWTSIPYYNLPKAEIQGASRGGGAGMAVELRGLFNSVYACDAAA